MFEKSVKLERFFSPGRGVMDIASRKAVTCDSESSIREALELMLRGRRKLPVVEKGEFAGIVTLNDVLNYCGAGDMYQEFLKREEPLEARVAHIMAKRVVTVKSAYKMGKVLELFRDFGRGSYPVTRGKRVVGMVSDWDLLKKVKWKTGMDVREVMVRKPAQVKEAYPLLDVARIMVKAGYRRLPVTRFDIITGIVVPSDIAGYLEGGEGIENLRKSKTNISRVMNRDVITVEQDDDVGKAATLMLKHRIGGLPVTEDGELIGIITESDIVQGMI